MIGSEPRQGFDDQCLGVIASRLRHAAYASGEVIFEYGERGDEMFLVVEGAVVVRAGPHSPAPAEKSDQRGSHLVQSGDQKGSNAVDLAAGAGGPGERIAGKGDVFGEGGLFPEELGPIRLESAKALSFVSVLTLTAAFMREIEAEYPAVNCLNIYVYNINMYVRMCTSAPVNCLHSIPPCSPVACAMEWGCNLAGYVTEP